MLSNIATHTDPTASRGKSSADADIVEARYIDIVPNVRVVQAVDFVSDDPAFAGTMTMTWAVASVDGGTRVDITADDVPDGISADDHETGLASSLQNLATFAESWPARTRGHAQSRRSGPRSGMIESCR